jgi:hypothetical protein
MKFFKSIFLSIALILLASSCHSVTGNVYFRANAIPLTISVNTKGEINFSLDPELGIIPTPLGTFGVGLVINPAEEFNVENTLTVRLNGQDYFYDLHGQDFEVSFESGYYSEITLRKTGLNIYLELVRIEGDFDNPVQKTSQEDPSQFIMDYYALINNNQYDQSWSLLSDDFKDRNHGNNNGGYSGYVDWWNTVTSVTVSTSEIRYQSGESAKVIIVLHYEMKNGSAYEDRVYFQLIYDNSRETWLIDATPTDWNT